MKIIIAAATGTERKFTRRYLDFAGFRGSGFIEAWDNESITSQVSADSIDMLFVDLDCSGIKIKKLMLKLKDQVKVVAIVSATSKAHKDNLRDFGIEAVISKPLSAKKIKDILFESSLNSYTKGSPAQDNMPAPFAHIIK